MDGNGAMAALGLVQLPGNTLVSRSQRRPGADARAGAQPAQPGAADVHLEFRPTIGEFDLIGRYVDNLETLSVPAYVTMDFQLTWRPNKHFEAAVIGRNLVDSPSLRVCLTGYPFNVTEVLPSVYGTVTWRY